MPQAKKYDKKKATRKVRFENNNNSSSSPIDRWRNGDNALSSKTHNAMPPTLPPRLGDGMPQLTLSPSRTILDIVHDAICVVEHNN